MKTLTVAQKRSTLIKNIVNHKIHVEQKKQKDKISGCYVCLFRCGI